MRRAVVPVLAFLLGVTLVLVVYRSALRGPLNPAVDAPSPGSPQGAASADGPGDIALHGVAWKLVHTGRLREAQEEFLRLLRLNANDQDALNGLVVVRRYLAGDNAAVLKQQAGVYEEAIKRGTGAAGAHYSQQTLKLLLAASLQAIRDIQAQGGGVRGAGVQSSSGQTAPGVSAVPPAPVAAPAVRTDQGAPGPSTARTPATDQAGHAMSNPSGPFRRPAAAPSAAPPPSRRAPDPVNAKAGHPATAATTVSPATPAQKTPVHTAKAVEKAAAAVKGAPPPAVQAAKAAPVQPRTPPAAAPAASTPIVASTPAATGPRSGPVSTVAGQASPTAQGPAKPNGTPQAQHPAPAAPEAHPAPAPPASSPAPPRTAVTAAPASQAAPPASEAAASAPNNRLYIVHVGPISDRDRASAVARQLSAGGFSSPNVSSRTGYHVLSEPLPRSVADGLVATMAAHGFQCQVQALTGDTAQLVFGTFTSQRDAEALSQRISGQGYDAWVRETTVYTLQLGPYPQSSVSTITSIVRSGAPEAAVAADPVP